MSCPPLCCSAPARLTSGREVYPHRRDLAEKRIWKCDTCGGYVGCHPNTTTPLGTPATRELRFRRGQVHAVLDPLWQQADLCSAYDGVPDAVRRQIRNVARKRVYAWLAERMSLTADDCHVGMFGLDRCAEALSALQGVTYPEIREWARRRESAPERMSAA